MARSRRVLVILGMHRSGTSAFTRVANLLGAGLPSDLMPALPGVNETGFWESRAVADLNDEALETAQRSWDDVRPIPGSWFGSSTARRLRERAGELLRSELGSHRLFALKDPRLCVLLPLWQEAIADVGARASFVLVLRHPLEVAESIRVRDGFSRPQSLLLWARYVLEAERATRDQPRSFVVNGALLDDWKGVATRVSRDLRLRWPRSPATAAGEIEAFLEPSLRHHRFEASDLDAPEIPALVRRTQKALLAAARGEDSARRLDACAARLQEADGLYAGLLDPEGERFQALEVARSETARQESQLVDIEAGLEEAVAEAARQDSLRVEAEARLRTALADGEAQVRGVRSRAAKALARAEEAEEEARNLRAQVSGHQTEVSRLQELVAARDAENQRLGQRLATRDFEVRRLERRVAALARQLHQAEEAHRAHCIAVLGALDAATG